MGYIIVADPDDKFYLEEYERDDIKKLQKLVNGYYEVMMTYTDFKIPEKDPTNIDILCNEEGIYADTGYNNKVNAIATILKDEPIFGAVVFMKRDKFEYSDGSGYEEDLAGFEKEEAEYIKNGLFTKFNIKENKELIKAIHSAWDGFKWTPN